LDLWADEPVLDIIDDEAVVEVDAELAEAARAATARASMNPARLAGLIEPTFEVDLAMLRAVARETIAEQFRDVLRSSVTRAFRQLRGRLD
jgi:hypothetical protein